MRSHEQDGQRGESTSDRTSGFSVLEVIVALLLLGMLSATVWTGIRNTHAEVVAEAGILRAHLRFAQGMAMANNTAAWSVLINQRSYTLQRDGDTAPVNWPGENAATRILPTGVQFAQGTGEHGFCQWGCPGNTLTITLSDGQHQETIQVLSLTGLVQ